MKLRMAFVAMLILCVSVPAFSQESFTLSGTISGIPAVSLIVPLSLRADESSGANLGNTVNIFGNGPYQMALFSGVYNLRLSGTLYDTFQGKSIYLMVSFAPSQNLPITGDTTLDFALPIYEVTGVVTDTDGNPIPNVGLQLLQSTAMGSTPNGNTTTSAEPGFEGAYKLYAGPGTYTLRVSAPPALYPPFEIKNLHIIGDTVRTIVLSWDYSVLEDAIAAISPGLELHFDQFDVIDQDQEKIYEVPVTAPSDQMELIVNWGGSIVRAEVFRPNGIPYTAVQSETPPIRIPIANPELGIWKVKVTAIEVDYDGYPIAIVAGIKFSDIPVTDRDGDGFTEAEGDCNDDNSAIHPDAEELCGDGIDNNCDGNIDEGCVYSKTINSTLGDDPKPSLLDQDIFKITGLKGETITVRLDSIPADAGLNKRATMIITDMIKGTKLVELDRGVLPIERTVKFPATGDYLIIISEQPRFAKGTAYKGPYSLTVEGPQQVCDSLSPTKWVE